MMARFNCMNELHETIGVHFSSPHPIKVHQYKGEEIHCMGIYVHTAPSSKLMYVLS